MDIGPGDIVEHIGPHTAPETLTIGGTYFVKSVGQYPFANCTFCGKPDFVVLSGFTYGHSVCRFKPFHGSEIEKQQFKLKEPA